jgi:hypothetical protein
LGELLDHRENCTLSGPHVIGEGNRQDENNDNRIEEEQHDEIQGKTKLAYEQEQEVQDSNKILRQVFSATISFLTQFHSESLEPLASMTTDITAAAYKKVLSSKSELSVSGRLQHQRGPLNKSR